MCSCIRYPTIYKLGQTFGSKNSLSPLSLSVNERNNFFKCFIRDLLDTLYMSTTCPSSIICRSWISKKKVIIKEINNNKIKESNKLAPNSKRLRHVF